MNSPTRFYRRRSVRWFYLFLTLLFCGILCWDASLVTHDQQPGLAVFRRSLMRHNPAKSLVASREIRQKAKSLIASNEIRQKTDVDAVVTYVNGTDPVFQHLRAKALAKLTDEKGHLSAVKLLPFAATEHRFVDHDDLKMLLRSLDRHGGIFRYVHLVVAGPSQVPIWIDRSNPRLKIVFHNEIWQDDSQLPNFNSMAIEANLHRIPGLSEYFVYFNDDVSLVADMSLNDFFTTDLKQSVEIITGIKLRTLLHIDDNFNDVPEEDLHWAGSAIKTRNLMWRLCGNERKDKIVGFGHFPHHVPHVFMRSVLEQASVDPAFSGEFNQTAAAVFRNGRELNLMMLFVSYAQCRMNLDQRHFELLNDSSVIYLGFNNCENETFALEGLAPDLEAYEKQIKKREMLFLCINDMAGTCEQPTSLGIAVTQKLKEFRRKLFPRPSSFELEEFVEAADKETERR